MNTRDLLPVYTETLYLPVDNQDNILVKKGNFQRKVLVLTTMEQWTVENEDFMKKILASCNLNDNDYLIAVVKSEKNIFETISTLAPEILFLFGIKFESEFFKANKQNYKPFIFNSIKIVLGDSLNIVKTDKEKRLALWNQCIKPLFNIS